MGTPYRERLQSRKQHLLPIAIELLRALVAKKIKKVSLMAVFKPISKHPEKFLKQAYCWLTPASSMGYSPHVTSPANWTIFTKMLMMIRMKRGNASSAPKALSWIKG